MYNFGSCKEWANDWTILGAPKWVGQTNPWAYMALAWNTAFIKKDSDPPFLARQILGLTYHQNVYFFLDPDTIGPS